MFVPRVSGPCDDQQYNFIPYNVTSRDQLPPHNFNVVAIAPWFSIECTLEYLTAAARGSARSLIVYKPNNSTNKPQENDSPVWDLGDDGAWKKKHHFPIFAIPGLEGQLIMEQLSLYSAAIDRVPHGEEINRLYDPGPNDYVRIWADLTMQNSSHVPAVWAFVLIVIGALLLVIGAVSLAMHFIQRRNRSSLKCRVQSGDVDLEAMGIKRLTVPQSHVESFALFTYNADPDSVNASPPPSSPSARPSKHTSKPSAGAGAPTVGTAHPTPRPVAPREARAASAASVPASQAPRTRRRQTSSPTVTSASPASNTAKPSSANCPAATFSTRPASTSSSRRTARSVPCASTACCLGDTALRSQIAWSVANRL